MESVVDDERDSESEMEVLVESARDVVPEIRVVVEIDMVRSLSVLVPVAVVLMEPVGVGRRVKVAG